MMGWWIVLAVSGVLILVAWVRATMAMSIQAVGSIIPLGVLWLLGFAFMVGLSVR